MVQREEEQRTKNENKTWRFVVEEWDGTEHSLYIIIARQKGFFFWWMKASYDTVLACFC